jgi:PA-IL-like protein
MKTTIATLGLMLIGMTTVSLADTLVLTNGRRIQGELTGVYGREIEFEERTGSNRRLMRVPRTDIARIEFDEAGSPPFGQNGAGGGIPRGMREREIMVTAREPWTDTGIDVRAGQMLYFSGSGEVRWGPNRRDGVAGERNSPRNYLRPMPGQPAAALIGRIGEQDSPFIIGDQVGPFRARSSGRLYLGVNDDVFTDNSGAFRVTIFY